MMGVKQDLYIQVTKDCNQECIFCTQPKEEEYLSLERIKKMALGWKEGGSDSIVLTGGEPSLHPDILKIIGFLSEIGMTQRMITNGANFSDRGFCQKVMDAGLRKFHFSVHSHLPEVAKLISKKDNLQKALEGIKNLQDMGAEVSINQTIITLNYPYLPDFVRYMTDRFPKIRHFVLNFVEIGGRAAENRWVVPKLSDVELKLWEALRLLRERGCQMRVERVPLCYMVDFEVFSSETRRILGNQEYHSYFLSKDKTQITGKDTIYSSDYTKSDDCAQCGLSRICVGVKNSYAKMIGAGELYPLFKRIEPFVDMNLSD
jgi:molybdenum cofactor biosynthesis enzyme MoaA